MTAIKYGETKLAVVVVLFLLIFVSNVLAEGITERIVVPETVIVESQSSEVKHIASPTFQEEYVNSSIPEPIPAQQAEPPIQIISNDTSNDTSSPSLKEINQSCQNNFECKSGVCSDGYCYDVVGKDKENYNLIQRILNWISRLFS